MEHDWERILNWFGTHAEEKLEDLEPAADDDALAAVEEDLGRPLPDDLRAFYALQDGTIEFGVFPDPEEDAMPYGPLSLEELPGAAEALESWLTEMPPYEVDSRYQAHVPAADRIAIGSNGGGDYLFFDLAPADAGAVGQIGRFDHEGGEITHYADSLPALLKSVADGLDSGDFYYDGDSGLAHGEGPPDEEE